MGWVISIRMRLEARIVALLLRRRGICRWRISWVRSLSLLLLILRVVLWVALWILPLWMALQVAWWTALWVALRRALKVTLRMAMWVSGERLVGWVATLLGNLLWWRCLVIVVAGGLRVGKITMGSWQLLPCKTTLLLMLSLRMGIRRLPTLSERCTWWYLWWSLWGLVTGMLATRRSHWRWSLYCRFSSCCFTL